MFYLHHDVKLMLIVKKNEKKNFYLGSIKSVTDTPDQKEILEYLCCAIVI